MAVPGASERIKELLVKADEATHANEHVKAASILREASQLEPENAEVKKRWLALQSNGGGGGVVEAIQTYLQSGKVEDGKHAVEQVKQKQLSAIEAQQIYDLLIHAKARPLAASAESTTSQIDTLLGLLLHRHVEARKLVAGILASDPTGAFQQLYDVGDETLKALLSIVLDAALWQVKEKQVAAQQDVFRMSIATLIQAGVDRPERAMTAITRLLTAATENIANLLDEDTVDIVLSDLDIRLPAPLRSQAMLSTSKMLEVTHEKGSQWFADFVRAKVQKQTNEDMILAFSAAAAMFPVLPQVASKLFMTDGFVQQLVPNLEKNSDAAEHGQRKSRTLEQAALELLSAACVDKACREAVERYCSHWLHGLAEGREGLHRALAALILAKIGGAGEQSVDVVTSKLAQVVLDKGEESELAIEGLAYTSLQPKVKEEVAGNPKLLRGLVTALKERPVGFFGCLTVFANLTAYRPVASEEQKKMSQLKAYANSSKLPPDDPLDDEKHVTARCKKVLDQDVVPALLTCCRQTTSPTNIALVVRIMLSLAKEQKHRAKMAQQGAVKLLLQIRERTATATSTPGQPSSEAALITHSAAHVLARLLISINPSLVFSAAFPATSAVGALTPLLSLDADSENRDLLPTFEALLALTNLASMDDAAPRELVTRSAFDKLEDLMFSSKTLVQRAAVELVCNLMASPSCVAKFADGSADSKRRLLILLALTDVEDLATRRAAGGALAMLTEWDVAVTALLDVKEGKGMRALVGMCGDESGEVVHRGLVCLVNVVGKPGEVGKRGVEAAKEAGALEVVREGMGRTTSKEILGLGVEVLKLLE